MSLVLVSPQLLHTRHVPESGAALAAAQLLTLCCCCLLLQDGMVYHHEVLEHGDFSKRQQVVRWIRRFPFSFLSDREYTIARREFREEDGSIYACTKVGERVPLESCSSRLQRRKGT